MLAAPAEHGEGSQWVVDGRCGPKLQGMPVWDDLGRDGVTADLRIEFNTATRMESIWEAGKGENADDKPLLAGPFAEDDPCMGNMPQPVDVSSEELHQVIINMTDIW
jgi:hypothetical protein